jgi:EmrB/QacA subfamily drug resistance transporter
MTYESVAEKADAAAAGPAADPRRWIALAVILVAAFMDLLDSTIVNVAIPPIQRSLHASYAATQWITAGYGLTFALGLITGGRLGDIYGRKRVFMVGVLGFSAASLMSALSPDPGVLITARLLQGLFAAIMVPQVLAIIHATFPPQERAKAFGMFGAVAGVAAISGLALGGALVQWNLFGLSWRLIFLINVPLGVAGLVVGARAIKESLSPAALRPDLMGVALATLGLFLLVFPLMEGRDLHWATWLYVMLGLSVPTLVLFVAFERYKTRKDGSPLMALGLFKARSFASGLAVQVMFFVGVGIFFLSWTYYMQRGLGWTPIHAGLTSIPFSAGAFVASAMSFGLLAEKFGRRLLQTGAILAVAGLAAYSWVIVHWGANVTSWDMAPPLLVFGVGFGWVTAPLPNILLSNAPNKDAGSASGLINTMQQLGGAVGAALVTVAFFGILGSFAASGTDSSRAAMRSDLIAAHVPAAQVDPLITAFRNCSIDSSKETNASIVPASCTSPLLTRQTPTVNKVLSSWSTDVRASTFAKSFRVALLSFVATTALAFLLMFALPYRAPSPHVAAVEPETSGTA